MNKQAKSRIRPINKENKPMVAKEEGHGGKSKMGKGEQEIQSSSYGKNKLCELKDTAEGIQSMAF